MRKLQGKLAAAAAFGFAATFFGVSLPARADQFYSTGNNHAQLHHVANIGNGHIEHTVVDRETHQETHYHFKGQYHWVTQGSIGGTQKFVHGINFTNGQGITGAPPAGPIKSDIRLKRDIVELGRLDNGIGLYRFRYNWSDQTYVGVMAQEVAKVVPEAVVRGRDGYLRVDYSRLGLDLMTWQQWEARQGSRAALH